MGKMEHQRIGTGLTDQHPLQAAAIVQAQPLRTQLVILQALGQPFIAGMADQAAQIVQHEPDLVVEQQGAEGAVVVEEVERGGEGGFVHGKGPSLIG